MSNRVKTIALTLSEKCNLNCVYCYEHNKDYSVMPYETAIEAIKKHFDTSDNYDEIEINFHGGEPFLVFDLIKDICEWMWSNQWSKPYHIFATTNGTVIDERMKKWLKNNRERFFVGLSLDGTKRMHDANRSSSYDLIDKEFFLENWPKQGIKMTITPFSVESLSEGVIELHKLGFIVNANPALGVSWKNSQAFGVYEKQLKILADFYIDNSMVKPCSLFNMNLAAVKEGARLLKPKWCGTGEHMIAISPEGIEYPCHSFMPSVNFGSTTCADIWELMSRSDYQDERCADCIIKQQCATCYGMNFYERGFIEKRDEEYCVLNKIRAIANSYLYGHIVLEPDKYYYFDKSNASDIALGVLNIQNAFCKELDLKGF